MKMTVDELRTRLTLGEDRDFEVKDSRGGFPKDFWKTYSAFGNTNGGTVVLGVSENEDETFEIVGVNNASALRKTFWDQQNNREKASVGLLDDTDVQVLKTDGKTLLLLHVPQAHRKSRPVFINNNPLTGSYKRNFEGDYRCDPDEVRRMLRDASDEPFDTRIFPKFTVDDIDSATLTAYRNRFHARTPDHPYLTRDIRGILTALGGWRRDRESGEEGLTLSGLLMFGKERSIRDALPHFHLDYQERFSDDPEVRWTHRITLDGAWEGNLFNFYFRVYDRLTQNLETPFKLGKDARSFGETHVHEALREALVNTLIHADHSGSRSILVVKGKIGFWFANPGRLRIPVDRLYEGGTSDCRNPNLQTMFQMLGLGEKAGSGFVKILRAWREQHWIIPLVSEKLDMDITQVFLPTISMIPDDAQKELEKTFGERFRSASELERTILVMAHQFNQITNTDLQRYRPEHPVEIGKCLRDLVERGMLEKDSRGRWTSYRLSGHPPSRELDLFPLGGGSVPPSSAHISPSSEHLALDSEHLAPGSERYERLITIAAPVRDRGKTTSSIVEMVILQVCKGTYIPLRILADIIGRSPATLRVHYIRKMVKTGRLELLYPAELNHPRQAYRSVEKA
jgi:ATP-dependent DNA helicase RecG